MSGNLVKSGNGIALRPYSLYKVTLRAYYEATIGANTLEVVGDVSGSINSMRIETPLYAGTPLTSLLTYHTTGSAGEVITITGTNPINNFNLLHVTFEIQELKQTGLNLCSISGTTQQSVTNQTLALPITDVQFGDLTHTDNQVNILAGRLYRITGSVETSFVPASERKSFQIKGSVSGNLISDGSLTNKGASNNACSCSSLSLYHTPISDEAITISAGTNNSASVDVIRAILDVVQVN